MAVAVKFMTDASEANADAALVATVPAMDRRRIGHIRHIENIANQLDGEWAHMGLRNPYQENFEAFRYQLAYMAFAIGLAHFHRAPAAPGYFRNTFDRLVQKMLLPDVWDYWRDTSRGGGAANLDAPRSDGWIDPVDRDNIMYSGYLQAMSVMYNYLFDDDKYTKPGALTLKFEPILFRVDERKHFVYDQNSINEHIYWRMVESGYLGVACEPYCVFQICNQLPILAFRLHDILKGTSRAEEVTAGFQAAWNQFGQVDPNGHFNPLVKTNLNQVQPNHMGPWPDAWLGALLHMWNPEFVRAHYKKIMGDWVKYNDDGTAFVPPATANGNLLDDLRANNALDFGFAAMWASEVGDTKLLNKFLKYADRYLNPTWEKGGYFYPRNDEAFDAKGNIVTVSPCCGNALLPYARLNVPNGLWKFYNEPWGREHYREPLLSEVADTFDVLRAKYFADQRKLVFTLSRRVDRVGEGRVLIANVRAPDRAKWRLSCNGVGVASSEQPGAGEANVFTTDRGDALELHWSGRRPADFVMAWS
jgi:hypothetical protein